LLAFNTAARRVYRLHEAEHDEGEQNEVNQNRQKVAPGQQNGARSSQGLVSLWPAIAFRQAQNPELVGEIYFAAHDEGNQWHDDVSDERIYDLAKRGADDDTDRQIDHVAPDSEFLELAQKTPNFAHVLSPSRSPRYQADAII